MSKVNYSTKQINKPSKQHTYDSRKSLPLWEEEINDQTGAAVGWLSLYHLEGTEEFVVLYSDLAKRRVCRSAADAKAKKAEELANAEFAKEPETIEIDGQTYHIMSLGNSVTVTVDGEDFTAYKPTVSGGRINISRHYTDTAEWIYDVTENYLGKFIITAWKTLNPDRFAALPSTPEQLEERNRRWLEEEAAAFAAEKQSA
jgi:hypothetical protein